MLKIWIASTLLLLGLGCEEKRSAQLSSADCNAPQTLEKEKPVTMSAKVVPEPVKYSDDVTTSIFDNPASQEEAKEEDLQKIKEEALKRLKDKETVAGSGIKDGRAAYVKGRSLAAKGRHREAHEFYLIACQSGYVEGCHKFAWHEEQAGNQANAHQFYRLACDGGNGKSCNNLAFQFEQQKRWDEAMDLYARACMQKHEPSCINLKRLHEEQLKAR